MREAIQQVLNLRKSGKTYAEIAKEVGRAKSTISAICKKHMSAESAKIYATNRAAAWNENKEAKLEAMRKAADAHYAATKISCIDKWRRAMSSVSPGLLCYIAGLYDGEGNHSGTEFNLTNSDKVLAFSFISFLRQIGCDYQTALYLHKSHNRIACEKWWEIKLDHVYSYDGREQKNAKNNEVKENYGTLKVRAVKGNGIREALKEVVSKLVASDGFDPSISACRADVIPFHQPASPVD